MEEEFVTWSKQKQQSWLSNLRNNFPSYSLVASIIVKGETGTYVIETKPTNEAKYLCHDIFIFS